MRVSGKESLPLPLHRHTPPSKHGSTSTQKLSQAVEGESGCSKRCSDARELSAGLGMVGLAATKSGSGEKEKAYIVRQNSVLKALLGKLCR